MSTETFGVKATAMKYSSTKRRDEKEKRTNKRFEIPVQGLPKSTKFEFYKKDGVFRNHRLPAVAAVQNYLTQQLVPEVETMNVVEKVATFVTKLKAKQVIVRLVGTTDVKIVKGVKIRIGHSPAKQVEKASSERPRKSMSKRERLALARAVILKQMRARPFIAEDRQLFDEAFESLHHDPL